MFPFGGHSNPAIDNAVESATSNSNFVPRAAFFAVYVPRNTCLHGKTQLRLFCIPTSKRCKLNDEEEKLGNILIGDGSSDIPMCSNEKAYIFLSEGIVTPLIPGRFQRLHVSLQEELVLKNLKVLVENQGELTISFCGSEERDEGNMLCEMDVTLPPSANDLDKTPVEFFGLPFDDVILLKAPFEGPYGILTACKEVLNDIGQGRIYDHHKGSEDPKNFLMALSRLDPEHKESCFYKIVSTLEKGGVGPNSVRDHLMEAKKKISVRISDRVCDVVADRFQCGISWRTLAGDLCPKIKDDEINAIEVDRGRCPKECCRAVLQKWSQKYTDSATYKELMRCLTNMGLANVNWKIMRELELVKLEKIPLSER